MIFSANERQRGIIPFRQSRTVRNHLAQYRRGGEPSPSETREERTRRWIETMNLYDDLRRVGRGKAAGSYTEQVRHNFDRWLRDNNLFFKPLSFRYKLSRHRIITVVGTPLLLHHDPLYGHGKQGFVFEVRIHGIDGVQFSGLKTQGFQATRILSSEFTNLLNGG